MPEETSLLNDITSLNNANPTNDTNSASDNVQANNVNVGPDDNSDEAAKPSLTRHIIFTLLPANIIFALPIYYFMNYANDMNWRTFNYMFAGYIVVFLLLYGVITYKLYPKISSKVLLVTNIINLVLSLLINYIVDMFSKQSDWFFYSMSLMQNLILIWAMLLVWQGLARFLAWIKYLENSENPEDKENADVVK